jgi:hypothetical protein
MRIIALVLILGWSSAGAAMAADAVQSPAACVESPKCGNADRCCHCGRACEKQCQVVCEMKEVKKTVWVVKCEKFCTIMPGGICGGCKAGQQCGDESSCNEGCGGKCDPCASENNKCIVPPKCGKERVKKTLVKKEIICKTPTYKCVSVYSCPSCSGGEKPAAAPSPAPQK